MFQLLRSRPQVVLQQVTSFTTAHGNTVAEYVDSNGTLYFEFVHGRERVWVIDSTPGGKSVGIDDGDLRLAFGSCE
jgi:hypothetical protein